MHRSGHYGVALLAYAPLVYVLASAGRLPVAAAGGALVLALTTLPDVDHAVPLVDHRGPTHTLAFAAFVGAAVGGLAWYAPLSASSRELLAFGAGGLAAFAILAHLAADVLTPAGVALLWPLTGRRFSLGVASAGSPFWNVALFGLGVFATVAAVLAATHIYVPT